MKKRLTALFLCCVLAFGLLTAALTSAVSADDGFPVCTASGAVTEVSVPRGEKVALTAVPGTESGSAQWQILLSADTDTWVDIAGETSTNISVSYAMLASVLYENRATIRCRFTASDGTETFSTRVTVTITDAAAETAVPAASEPVITAGQTVTASEAAPAGNNASDYAVAPASLDDGTGDAQTVTQYEFKITYTLEDGTGVYEPYVAKIAAGDSFPATKVTFPTVQGYLPYIGEERADSYTFSEPNVSAGKTVAVVYKPTKVTYTVEYYLQNEEGDGYTLDETDEYKGLTGSAAEADVPEIPGLIALNYDRPAIAADGSTVVKVYYDRRYYLLTLDLDGGVGTTAVYARYGTTISVADPTKANCTFKGWLLNGEASKLPTSLTENAVYKANWVRIDSQTIVNVYVCGEQANSEDYDTTKSTLFTVAPGTVLTVCEDGRILKCNEEHEHDDGSCYFNAVSGMSSSLWKFRNTTPETITAAADGTTSVTLYYDRKEFTLSFYEEKGKPSVATITAKWGANIVSRFENHPRFFYDYAGRTWQCEDTTLYDEPIQSIATMPQCDAKFYLVAEAGSDNFVNYSATLKTIRYYVQDVNDTTATSSTWPTGTDGFSLYKTNEAHIKYACYDEEYHEIPGFTRYASKTAGFTEAYPRKYFTDNELNLYYLRNSYKLTFCGYNNGVIQTVDAVRYGASLSEYASYVPDFPGSYLDANGYVFDGWYTQPNGKGTKVDFTTMTMPAADTVLYAHYVENTHTVRTFASAADTADAANATAAWTVTHGAVITDNKPADPTATDGSTFVSWVYKDANGTEKAFTFDEPVESDMDLYPKFTNDATVSYTVSYKYYNDVITIADPITGTGVAGTTLTFYAKVGDELYGGDFSFQQGYFPWVREQTITLKAGEKNELVFSYSGKGESGYTVQYLDKDGKKLADDKVVDKTSLSAVTEQARDIAGYVPDAYEKDLIVLTTDQKSKNVITFYYTKDTSAQAAYTVTHYTVADGTCTEYASSEIPGEIGTVYTASPMSIPGCSYDEQNEQNVRSGTLTAEGLELKLYYTENQATIQYKAATEGGMISSDGETVSIFTGTPGGCTPTANEGYWFVGWFTDEKCTAKVDDNFVKEYNTLVPGKTASYGDKAGYASATYYAKFERDIPGLTISVSGCADENQSFLFKISGNGTETMAVIRGSGSVTIAGLTPDAEYTVTECSWSWRFAPKTQTVTVTANGDNKVSFENTRKNLNWLSGEALYPNAAGKASAN